MDPLAISSLIAGTYRRYLRSLLPVRDPAIARAMAAQISTGPLLTKGPLLEATPAYQTGATLGELIREGILDPSFAALDSAAMPLDRPLYLHQEQALRKAAAGRNLVVATGTGSGKTESFLLPILSALSAEYASGELGPGVRALLLYPMNALANDQLKRLRELLATVPYLTFGRYTGDTPERAAEGASRFAELNPGMPRRPNELLSREEMRANPPHLLLTNYAMLEYLLLRPADLELFEGRHGRRWRFIVLDEAHVYDGAKAEELGMLLRRLRDRVARGSALQCIATSATVGSEPPAVMDFATGLFNTPFEWVPGDPTRQDLVRASRETLPAGPFWGPLSAQDYVELARGPDPVKELAARGEGHDAATALAAEHAMATLRTTLAAGPRSFPELARLVFEGQDEAEAGLAALVAVGAAVRGRAGGPVLSARFHLFARATEGAFTCLGPAGPHVSLARHEVCTECSGAMFEFGACKRCGAVYLLGTVEQDGGPVFSPRAAAHDGSRVWLLLGDAPEVTDEDEETLEEAGPARPAQAQAQAQAQSRHTCAAAAVPCTPRRRPGAGGRTAPGPGYGRSGG